jgi:hypothetical protein
VSKIIVGTVAGLFLLSIMPPIHNHLDQKIMRPIRNWNASMNHWNKFVMQEEFHKMLKDLGHGIITFYKADD